MATQKFWCGVDQCASGWRGVGEWRDEHSVGSWSRSQRSLEGVGKRQTYPFGASACGPRVDARPNNHKRLARFVCPLIPPRMSPRIPLYSPTGILQCIQTIRVACSSSHLLTANLNASRASARRASQRASPFHRPASSRASRVDHPLAPTAVHYCLPGSSDYTAPSIIRL